MLHGQNSFIHFAGQQGGRKGGRETQGRHLSQILWLNAYSNKFLLCFVLLLFLLFCANNLKTGTFDTCNWHF